VANKEKTSSDGERSSRGFSPWVSVASALAVAVAVSGSTVFALGTITARGILADIEIAAAVTVLAAIISRPFQHRMRPLTGVVVLALLTLTVFAALAATIRIIDTAPGRTARDEFRRGSVVPLPKTERPGTYKNSDSLYGEGRATFDGSAIVVQTESERSAMYGWFLTDDPGSKYYAEVHARKVSGGDLSTACVLSFGYHRDNNWWYGLQLIGSRVVLGRHEFQPPGRRLDGPKMIYPETTKGHRLAVLRDDRTITLFVDDRRVFRRTVPRRDNLDGGITFGTLDTGSQGKGSMACEFTRPYIRRLDT
jgi:hypothetical protein